MALDGRKVNLFIVGAAKCGTTSLHYYLSQHPDVFMCPVKEPRFFSEENSITNKLLISEPPTNIASYHDLFRDSNHEKIIGEASVTYLRNKSSAHKIFQYNPNTKIIIILRHPVERIISHYLYCYNRGDVKKSIIDEIKEDNSKIISNSPKSSQYFVEYGMYSDQIKRYALIFPKSSIKIIYLKEFENSPIEILNNCFAFLGVESRYSSKINFERRNVTLEPKFLFLKNLHFILRTFLFPKLIYKSVVSHRNRNFINKFFYKLPNKETFSELQIKYLKELYDLEITQLNKMDICFD